MKSEYILIATYTYPHEALFIESSLESKGIDYRVNMHKPFIANGYYAKQTQVKSILVNKSQIGQALSILEKISPDMHTLNRCTQFHTKELQANTKPTKSEKGFCWSCYGIMVSALGFAIYSIIHSIQCLF